MASLDCVPYPDSYTACTLLTRRNAKQMPGNVQESLRRVFVERGGMGEQEAEHYLAALLSSRRLQLETWA